MDTNESNLIVALQDPSIYPHPVESFSLIETHISWVLLTGSYAYKIKKPVNLGFLDFSTLEKRLFYCEEELRLNKRLAAGLYLGVVKITGRCDKPAFNGTGQAIEYAVKMVQFPQSSQLDRILSRDELTTQHIDQIAKKVAEFHTNCSLAGKGSSFGRPDAVKFPVIENFAHIRQQSSIKKYIDVLDEIQVWSEESYLALLDDFKKRKEEGFIRECHGDMHLQNITLLDGEVIVFDCLEFNEAFRWIDVMSDIAFLCMDLDDRNKQNYTHMFLNAYLELTGDYEGVTVLGFYQVYRAMVRAKVDAIRLSQSGLNESEKATILSDFRGYLHLAYNYTQSNNPTLFITHGLSASGKTTGTQTLVNELGAIRIRSDIERKRFFHVAPMARGNEAVGEGKYSREASVKLYARLLEISKSLLLAGRSVVVDATFLNRFDRDNFRLLANNLTVPFCILSFQVPESILRERIINRQKLNTDASDAGILVLANQIKNVEQIAPSESKFTVTIDYNTVINIDSVTNLKIY